MTLYYASDMVPCENAGYELMLLKWESSSYLTIVFWFHVRAIKETPQGLRFILSPTRLLGSVSNRFRFSKRNPARNVSTSDMDLRGQGDSNFFEGKFEAEERRSDGAPRGDAPKAINFELFDRSIEEQWPFASWYK